MIESLGQHGIEAKDLVPPLMTTHTVANPEYDPAEARRQAEIREAEAAKESADISETDDTTPPSTPPPAYASLTPPVHSKPQQTTAKVLEDTAAPAMPGVSTHLSAADKDVTLDIRWTVLCDLFLILIADSVYDARSRVLLESVALKLGLGWLDVVKFESRVTEALEIQEGVEKMEQQDSIQEAQKSNKKRRYMMLGLATLGRSAGGCVVRRLKQHYLYRWRSRYRSFGRSSCPGNWGRSWCCFHYHWYHWNDRVSCGHGWRCRDHDGWCSDGLRYRCTRDGPQNTVRTHFRYPAAA